MATGARGEGILEVDGKEYAILFTNRALAEAERATGKTITEIILKTQNNSLGIWDIAQLLAIGLEHARRDRHSRPTSYTINDAWTILDAVGFVAVLTVVIEALMAVVAYNVPKESEGPPA